MEKTKVVVIGTGAIAKEHLKCLKKLPCAEVVGVCDLSPAKAEAASERYHISQWDTNFKDLVKRVKPDIAHVTTSAASHFTIAKELLDSGISAFVEKPITQRYHEFRTLKSLAEKNSLILLENHNYQFNPPVQKALQGIKAGEFGEMHHVEITLCLDLANSDLFTPESTHPSLKLSGGIVMEFLTHLASLTYAFLGPHTSVYTLWEKKNASSPFPYDEFRALVKTNQGTASITFCSNAQPEGFWVSVYGSKMNASINLFESRLVLRKMQKHSAPSCSSF